MFSFVKSVQIVMMRYLFAEINENRNTEQLIPILCIEKIIKFMKVPSNSTPRKKRRKTNN